MEERLMELVNFGNTGLKVSKICLGCMTYGTSKWRDWVLDEDASKPFFRQAAEAGINFYDTADMYSLGVSEEVTGRAVKAFWPKREQVVVATKVFNPMGKSPNEAGLSRKHIMHAIDNSLRRLGMDYVDLYQIHRFDPKTPIEETIEALHDVVKAGKALYVGASSMYAWQFAKYLSLADAMGKTRFVSMQNHYNLIYREEEREMLPLCRDQGIAVIPWSPLARGFLAGNRKRGDKGSDNSETTRARSDEFAHTMYYHDSDFDVVDRVTEIAQKRGVSNAQVALAWLMQQKAVTAPIVGASKPHHLQDAIAAASLKLDDAELKALSEPYKPHPVLGHR
jgi:aryl-alcohol dehydrogenase (NADP+)